MPIEISSASTPLEQPPRFLRPGRFARHPKSGNGRTRGAGLGHGRRGVSTVEFAVSLPILVVIVFGAIEATSMIFLKQALVQASYESVKICARTEGTRVAATRVANEVAAGRRIQNLEINFEPNNIETAPRGSLIRVTVSAPGDANSLTNFGIFAGRRVVAQAVMAKE